MKYNLPQLLPHCNARKKQFCPSCRDKLGGKDFRQGVLKRQGIEDVHVDFICPLGIPWSYKNTLSISEQTTNAAKAIVNGVTSTIKTTVLRKDRVTDDEYRERLNVCTNCPSNQAVFRNGALFTCGKFKDSITGKLPTCGCVLTKKARDVKQDCPLGHWTKLTIEGSPTK